MKTFPMQTVVVILLGGLLFSCSSAPSLPEATRIRQAKKAVTALQQADFRQADAAADRVLQQDSGNPQALLVKAVVLYRAVTKKLTATLNSGVSRYFRSGNKDFSHNPIRMVLRDSLKKLATIEKLLRRASVYRWVYLELNLASWRIDWNNNGRIDGGDRRLMQVEYDLQGKKIPRDDPRRKPTFRFDVGDVHWAIAYVSFQQAAINLLLAFEVPLPAQLYRNFRRGKRYLTVKLVSRRNITRMRDFILQGLRQSGLAREAYLREKDDDREWVPNPRQKDGPMQMPVSDSLYSSWKGTLRDVTRMVKGREGLDLRALVLLFVDKRTVERHFPIEGYLNIGRMLSRPKDIKIDLHRIERLSRQFRRSRNPEVKRGLIRAAFKEIFGKNYRRRMRPSPITRRLSKMKNEMQMGVESFDRKLKYLLWIN